MTWRPARAPPGPGANTCGTAPAIIAAMAATSRCCTYIASGNVVFEAPSLPAAVLTERVERIISAAFPYRASIVLRSRDQMRAIVRGAPPGFGSDPGAYRYDVIFLKPPLSAREAMATVSTRAGVDEAHLGRGVLYFSRLAAKASQSRLSSIVGSPIYPRITIRSWNTTARLLGMLEERS
jgi:uncharacterized protein (DUF1697 family)